MTPTTTEMNKAFAEFMGYYWQAGKYYSKVGGKGNWFKEATYHSDWNKLMPVWKEIQFIGADKGRSYERFWNAFHVGVDKGDILSAHQACYEFICWLKQNTNGK